MGIDGCRAGWFAVEATCADDSSIQRMEPRLLCAFSELFAMRSRPRFVAVDMPIGLLAERVPGGRNCDRMARLQLGPRRSSIFSAPTRDVLAAREWSQVEGMSKQSFYLLPKVREVDAQLTPARQRWIRETHPEMAFARLAGAPLTSTKRTAAGRAQRLELVTQVTPHAATLYHDARASWRRTQVAPDDILDALVLTLVASDMLRGRAQRTPEHPPRDPRGLLMQIWS